MTENQSVSCEEGTESLIIHQKKSVLQQKTLEYASAI
jgi:hypothetical protein